MTRINSAISVRCLTDEHLLAEHREIKRIPYCLEVAAGSGSIDRIPDRFRLGKGHVMFFLDKIGFIYRRYCELYSEAVENRGFSVTSYHGNFGSPLCMDERYRNTYEPTEEEKVLLIGRISERILSSRKSHFHYYGRKITKEEAIRLLYK